MNAVILSFYYCLFIHLFVIHFYLWICCNFQFQYFSINSQFLNHLMKFQKFIQTHILHNVWLFKPWINSSKLFITYLKFQIFDIIIPLQMNDNHRLFVNRWLKNIFEQIFLKYAFFQYWNQNCQSEREIYQKQKRKNGNCRNEGCKLFIKFI